MPNETPRRGCQNLRKDVGYLPDRSTYSHKARLLAAATRKPVGRGLPRPASNRRYRARLAFALPFARVPARNRNSLTTTYIPTPVIPLVGLALYRTARRALASRRSNAIGAVIPTVDNAIFARFNSAGLAFDRNSNTVYSFDSTGDQLITVNAITGSATSVGVVGFTSLSALAFDPNSNVLYGADSATDQLIVVNTTTGAGTAVGPLGFTIVAGLAFDPTSNTLYGVDTFTGQLITIDTASGVGTAVGPLGLAIVSGLAFDSNSNTLYGTNTSSDELISIDTATGAGTVIGSSGVGILGLAPTN